MSVQALNDLSDALTKMHSSGEIEAAVYADCVTRIDAAKQAKFTPVASFPVAAAYTNRPAKRQRIIPGDSELSSPGNG